MLIAGSIFLFDCIIQITAKSSIAWVDWIFWLVTRGVFIGIGRRVVTVSIDVVSVEVLIELSCLSWVGSEFRPLCERLTKNIPYCCACHCLVNIYLRIPTIICVLVTSHIPPHFTGNWRAITGTTRSSVRWRTVPIVWG
jgi:hypothetical protein